MNELIEYGDCIELNRKSEIIVIRVMRMKNVMMIGENCCNEVNLSCLDVSRVVDLKWLVIGSKSLNEIVRMRGVENEIVNMRGVEYELLNEVIIGENSVSWLSDWWVDWVLIDE